MLRRFASFTLASFAALTIANFARAAEPPRIDLQKISSTCVIDNGRAILAITTGTGGSPIAPNSAWAVIDPASGKVIRRGDVPRGSIRGVVPVSPASPVVLMWGQVAELPHDSASPAYLATWDVQAGKELAQTSDGVELPIVAAAITPDGTRVLTAHGQRPLRLYDMRARTRTHLIEMEKNIGVVAMSADAKRAVLGGGSASGDENIYLWDLEANQQLKTFSGHRGKIAYVSFWPDERTILSGSDDGTIRLWDVETARELRRMRSPDAPVVLVAPHADGRRIFAASDAPFGTYDPMKSIMPVRDVRLWDALAGQVIGEPKQYSRQLIESLGFADDGRAAIATLSDYTIERRVLPEPPPAARDKTVALDRPLIPDEPDAQIYAIESDDRFRRMGFLPDGRLFSLGERNAVTRWDIDHGIRIGVFVPPAEQHIGDVSDVSADGRLAVSEHGTTAATVWELASGLAICEARINSDEGEDEDFVVVSHRLSPDGRLLGLGVSRLDSKVHRVRFFRTGDGTSAGKIVLGGYGADPLAYSPDGSRIAVADIERNESVAIFDLDSGKQVKTLRLPKGVGGKGTGWTIMTLRFSADGSRVMTEASDRLICWTVADEKVVANVPLPRTVQSIAFSPDGRRALTGDDDSNVRLFDLATQKQLALFDHPRGTPTVVFSPDGTRAIAGGGDGTLHVFRLPEQKKN